MPAGWPPCAPYPDPDPNPNPNPNPDPNPNPSQVTNGLVIMIIVAAYTANLAAFLAIKPEPSVSFGTSGWPSMSASVWFIFATASSCASGRAGSGTSQNCHHSSLKILEFS